jgi:phosphoribosylaminoimidazole-succinocarboxamide synthase
MTPLLSTNLPWPKRSGKVRDVYTLDEQTLLIIATDRISAFDCIMPNGIPGKGKLLTQISNFWFATFDGRPKNHLLETDVDRFPATLASYRDQLAGRSVLARRTNVVPIECVARGYLAGSGWKEYRASQSVCGVALPAGLQLNQKLPAPIFTPATKAESGHDENVSIEIVESQIGKPLAQQLKSLTLDLYTRAAEFALQRGIIIADTKFEFGLLPDGELILIDEILTPDSSRFWPAELYRVGVEQPSYDKQFVRDWLESSGWNKTPPAPALPDDVISKTREKYEQAMIALTGRSID